MAAISMNSGTFREVLDSGDTFLVDFWAPWCTYCRRIDAVYDTIAKERAGKLLVAKVNIDKEAALAEDEQIEVIPTLVLYQNGKAVGSIVAPESKTMIDSFIDEALQ